MVHSLRRKTLVCVIFMVVLILFTLVNVAPFSASATTFSAIFIYFDEFEGEILLQTAQGLTEIKIVQDTSNPIMDVVELEEGRALMYVLPEKEDIKYKIEIGEQEFFITGEQHIYWEYYSETQVDIYIKKAQEEQPPEPEKYIVRFNAGEGAISDASLQEQIVECGKSAVEPTVEPPTGYEFDCWDTDFDFITEDIIISAVYKLKEYTVRFYLDHNSEPISTQKVGHNQSAVSPQPLEEVCRTFQGWDSDYSAVTSNMDIYAIWEINIYLVSFDIGDGQAEHASILEQLVEYGKSATAPIVTPPTGYEFDCWDTDFDFITEDIIISAVYKLKEYTVRFYLDHNSEPISTQKVGHNQSAVSPQPLEEVGRTFQGWDSDYSAVTSNMDIYAIWEIHKYTVTFYGFNNVIIAEIEVEHGQGAQAPTDMPVIVGYRFMGWGNADLDCVTTDLQVYASYSKEYKVVFDLDGGSANGELEQIVLEGGSAIPPTDTSKVGYTFLYWNGRYEKIVAEQADESGIITITAIYIINTYKVSYYAEAVATELLLQNDCEYNSPLDIAVDIEYEKTGYTFIGWGNEQGVQYGTDYKVVSDMDIYAIWEINKYTVTFYGFDNVIIAEAEVEHGQGAQAPTDMPIIVGYRFMGWGGVDLDGITSALQVYASYSKEYTVVFDLDGGSANGELEQIVLEGGSAMPPTNIVKTGYDFVAWSGKYADIVAEQANENGIIIIKAEYTIIKYKVRYYVEGGLFVVKDFEYNLPLDIAVDIPDYEKIGYTFLGWGDEQGIRYNADFKVVCDMDIYAIFDKNMYTVTFYDGQDCLRYYQIEYQEEIYEPGDMMLQKNGYDFVGWYKDKELSCPFCFGSSNKISGDTNIYAKYTPIAITITISDNLGGEYENVIAEAFSILNLDIPFVCGYKISVSASDQEQEYHPILIGYRFEVTLGYRNMDIIYIYEKDTYSIAFVCQMSPDNAPDTITAVYEESIELEEITIYGYDFIGYFYDEEYAVKVEPEPEHMPYSASKDKTTILYIKLEKQFFTLDFETVGGSDIAPIEARYQDEIDLEQFIPSKLNMEFLEWQDKDGNSVGSTYILEGNYTLTAHYGIIREYFDISFHTPDSFVFNLMDGKKYVAKVACGDKIAVPFLTEPDLPIPKVEGYAFLGWFLDEECTNKYEPAPISSDINLYAKFDIIRLTVTFVCRDKTIKKQVDYFSPMPQLVHQELLCEYHTFVGWDREIDYIKEDTKFTALYTPLYNIVVMDGANRELSKPAECELDEFLSSVKLDLAKDEIFLGWTIGSYDSDSRTYSYVPNIIKIEQQSGHDNTQYLLYISLLINVALVMVTFFNKRKNFTLDN